MKHFIKSCNNVIIILQIQILLLLIAPSIFSQWQQTNGPEGGNFNKILSIDGDLFAFSRHDLFVSTNDGLSWNWRSTFPMEFNNVYLDGSDLYIIGRFGICLSSDKGNTWTKRNNGLDSLFATYSLARLGSFLFLAGQVNPNSPDIHGALYKSSDHGESWDIVPFPFVPNNTNINSFLVIDSVLLAVSEQGIYRSSNGGSSWQWVFSSFYTVLPIDSILVLSTYNSIYQSTDTGVSWQIAEDSIGASSFLKYNGTILASTGIYDHGLLQSTDLGKSWHSLPLVNSGNITIRKLYQSKDYLFGLDSFVGLYRSEDGGITWQNISTDFSLPFKLIPSIIKDSLILMIDYYNGIFRSTDFGTTWNDANKGLNDMPFYYMHAEDNILLASSAYPSSSRGKLFRSSDNGNNWEIATSDIQNYMKCFLKFKEKIFAGTQWGGIVVSTDDGITWTTTNLSDGNISSIIEINGNIYAGSSGNYSGGGEGLYISTDDGNNWNLMAKPGLPSPIFVDDIIKVEVPKEMRTIIFINTDRGIFRSDNEGNNWVSCNNNTMYEYIWTIAATHTSTNSGVNLFAANKSHFFFSSDLGDSWNLLDNIYYGSSLSLYSYPEDPGLGSILLANADSRIFMSSDQGNTWQSIEDNLENTAFYDIDINSDYLYAGTSRGIWKRPLPDIVSSTSESNVYPEQFILGQNYPNPFNPSTTINFELPKRFLVNLKVYDSLGKEVAVLVNGKKPAGKYNISFNAAGLSSGIYFYVIKAGNNIISKKMVLIKNIMDAGRLN